MIKKWIFLPVLLVPLCSTNPNNCTNKYCSKLSFSSSSKKNTLSLNFDVEASSLYLEDTRLTVVIFSLCTIQLGLNLGWIGFWYELNKRTKNVCNWRAGIWSQTSLRRRPGWSAAATPQLWATAGPLYQSSHGSQTGNTIHTALTHHLPSYYSASS